LNHEKHEKHERLGAKPADPAQTHPGPSHFAPQARSLILSGWRHGAFKADPFVLFVFFVVQDPCDSATHRAQA
jgi:hypothetical protein